MSSRVAIIDTGVSISFITSTVIHLAVFLLLAWWGQLFPAPVVTQETYYVDVVNLPVADPNSGTATQTPVEATPKPLPAPAPPIMTVRSPKSIPKSSTKPVKQNAPQDTAETESAFAERMAAFKENEEARQYEEKLKKLGNKKIVASSAKSGPPSSGGTETGSRYVDFIKSRLEDALKTTSYSTTKNPEVAVRLTISAEGKLLRMKIERSNGDAAFELAVRRAIDLASEKFTVPPNHTIFDNGFVFKPKGISSSTSR